MDDQRPSQGSRQLDHTADLALEFWAPTEQALLLEGARAMVEVMTDGASIDANHRDRIEVDSIDREDRMVQWLNQILYAAIVDGFVLANATIALRENGLTATVNGASNARDLITTELKSVTYHDLHLDNHPHGWYARVVIDV
jgi:SHS2 domain-containing protein